TYRNGFFWDRPRQALPITEEVAYSLVLACALHAVFAPVVVKYFWPIDFQALAILLLGQYGKDSEHLGAAVNAITSYPWRVFLYFIVLYAIAAAIGYCSHARGGGRLTLRKMPPRNRTTSLLTRSTSI